MTQPIYRFDPYSVDPATRELRCDGVLVVLSPKVFDCLAWLIEHRDRAVGRDELVAAVWGKVDVADTQLVQAILKARRAIGDSGEEQCKIRTIPRFGYRWVADVRTVEDLPPAPVPGARPAKSAVGAPAGWLRGPRMLLLGAAVAGAAWWFGTASAPPILPSPVAVTGTAAETVVLPAAVRAADEWAWLRLGAMDLVARHLRGAGLAVVPSDNVVALVRDSPVDGVTIERVRKAVAPTWLVVPTVRHSAAGWTVHLELLDPRDGRRVVEAGAADPATAAHEAAQRLLGMLGRGAVDSADDAPSDAAPRIRAALLANDFEAARQLLAALPASAREVPDIRLFQAQVAFGLGRFQSARDGFSGLLGLVGDEADPLFLARALNGRGASALRLGEAAAGEHDFDRAVALLRDHNEPALAGQAYAGRAVARALQRHHDAALTDFARARTALHQAGDTLALARVDANEGALNGQLGRTADALANFRRAADQFERYAALNEWASALANQVEAHLALLEPKRAERVSEKAQALIDRLDNPSVKRLVSFWRAAALAAVGRLMEADERLDTLVGSSDAGQDTGVQLMSLNRQAALALGRGQAARAVLLARQALAGAVGAPWLALHGEAWLTLIRALRSRGSDGDASAEVRRFVAWAKAADSAPVAMRAHLAEAELAWSERRREAAAQAYGDAMRYAEQATVPADIAEVGVSWGNSLIAEGELEQAGAVVGRVARWADTDFACALLQARLYHALGHTAPWQAAMAHLQTLAGERAIPPTLRETASVTAGIEKS